MPNIIPPDAPLEYNKTAIIVTPTPGSKYTQATEYTQAMELLPNAGIDEASGRALEYQQLIKTEKYQKWFTSCANEFR
eukprot:6165394-Ditylum_brightwellii.AAC.1